MLTLTIVASLLFVVGVAVRVDWQRYRGSWLVFTAGVVEIGWLLLMLATYQPAD